MISIIIPVYNGEKDIKNCLESLLKQALSDFEIIVIDDGSSDRTRNILSELKTKSSKLLILYQQHKGPGAARNFGTTKARGEILVFVDADMTFDKHFLQNLVKPILTGKTKGTFSKNEYVANWGNVWARCWNINEGWEPKRRHPKNYPDKQPVFRAILKKEFTRVGGFDPKAGYMDDWTLSKKLGYEATSAPEAVFYHQNPDDLGKIFRQAKWVSKRPYKLGTIGTYIALARAFLPFSLIFGFYRSLVSGTPAFLLFKIVYDFGIFAGIIEKLLYGKIIK